MVKKIIIWGGGALVLLAVIVLVAVFLSLDTIVKRGVETVGPQLTRSDVKLGGVSLSPFSGSGKLSGLVVGNPAGYKTPAAIKVGKLQIAVDIASLKSDVIIIKTIHIEDPEITYEGGITGENNISRILDNVKAATGTTTTATAKPGTAPAAGKKFVVRDVVIEGAKLRANLTGIVGQEITLPLPTLHLQNIGNDGKGVDIGEVVQQIIAPLLASITESIGKEALHLGKEAAGNILKGAGKDAGAAIEKAGDALKGLFKK